MLSLWGLVQGAWFESCSESCRGNCGFRKPQAKGGELTTFCITKDTGTQPDEWTISRGRTFTLRLWGYEIHGVPLFEVLPWGNQLELLFCYCTRVKSRIETTETLLWETWVWGGQREDLVCLCVCGGGRWGVEGEVRRGLGPSSGSASMTARAAPGWSDRKISSASPCYQVCQSYSLHQSCSICSFSKEYFAALAKCVLHHSKSVTFKKKVSFLLLEEIWKIPQLLDTELRRGEGLQSHILLCILFLREVSF